MHGSFQKQKPLPSKPYSFAQGSYTYDALNYVFMLVDKPESGSIYWSTVSSTVECGAVARQWFVFIVRSWCVSSSGYPCDRYQFRFSCGHEARATGLSLFLLELPRYATIQLSSKSVRYAGALWLFITDINGMILYDEKSAPNFQLCACTAAFFVSIKLPTIVTNRCTLLCKYWCDR